MHIRNQHGQTLIEVLIAIVVILVGMLGVLALAQSNINNERLGSDRLIATQLARESLELVRATRDSNFLQAPSVAWDAGLGVGNGLACGTTTGDTVNLTAASSCPPPFSTGYQLKYDSTTELYSLGTGNPTKFYRHIETRPICQEGTNQVVHDACADANSQIGMEVRSYVGWTHFNVQKNVVLVEQLFNWR